MDIEKAIRDAASLLLVSAAFCAQAFAAERPSAVCRVVPSSENPFGINVFEQGRPLGVRLAFDGAPEGASAKCEVFDFWGSAVWSCAAMPLERGAVLFRPAVSKAGWHRMDVKLLDRSGAPLPLSFEVAEPEVKKGLFAGRSSSDAERCVAFSVIPPLAREKGVISVHSGVFPYGEADCPALCEALRLSSAPWAREALGWARLEQSPGAWTWRFERGNSLVWNLDKTMDGIAKAGAKAVAFYASAPEWTCAPSRSRAKPGKEILPEDLFAAYRMAKEMAERYGGVVRAWEIWNEPDIAFPGSSADQYASCLKATALGLMAAKNRPEILNGPFARDVRRGYIDLTLDNGVASYLDAYSFHSYAPLEKDVFGFSVDSHMELLARRGLDKPAWMTETGRAFSRGKAQPFDESSKDQVDYLLRSAATAFARGVDKPFYFILRPYYSLDGRTQFGLLRKDLTPYPAYQALAVMNNVLSAGSYEGSASSGDLERHLFSTPRGRVALAWSVSGAERLKLPGPRPELLDAMGGSVEPARDGDAWSAPLKKGLPLFVLNPDPSLKPSKPARLLASKAASRSSVEDLSIVLALRTKPEDLADDSGKPLQNWDGLAANWAPLGYKLSRGSKIDVSLEVYNFGKEAKSVSLKPSFGGLASPSLPASVEVGPMEKASVPFSLELRPGVQADAIDAKLEAAADGKPASPLAFRVFLR